MNYAHKRPIARQEGLVIQEMPDEVLVFDMETNKAHCLNETAAFVWKACDGTNSVTEITKLFGSKSGKTVDENLVWLAIDQLNENNLLAEELKADFKGQSRRDVIKKIGLAAVIAMPVVASLVAPKSALAVVCGSGAGGNCTLGGQNCDAGTACVCDFGPNAGLAGTCDGAGVCFNGGVGCGT